MIHKGTRRAPDLHVLSAEAPSEALEPKSRTKNSEKGRGQKQPKSSLFFRIFMCQITCTISINRKKFNICSCREMLMPNPVKPAVSEWSNKPLQLTGSKPIS